MIATDPPFNTGRDFHATKPKNSKDGEKEKIKDAKFQDRWTWDDNDIQHGKWLEKVKNYSMDVYHVIEGSRKSYGDDMGAFLCFMAARLMEMRRVLKPSGSIYLHCDPTASHYLKMIMDAIFGRDNFRNEIIWCYRGGGVSKKAFAKKHDVILSYAKNIKISTFNVQYSPYSESSQNLVESKQGVSIDGKKRDLTRGAHMNDWWVDINSLQTWSPERTGYPTQKPLKLYKRIIEASTNPGDVVLDPFCGCATTLLAAETLKNKRQWIGIDIWEGAHDMVIERLKKEGFLKGPDGEFARGTIDMLINDEDEIIYKNEPEQRGDGGKEAAPDLKVKITKGKKKKSVYLDRTKAKKDLLERDGYACQGCGRSFEDERYLEIDHKMPKSDGGTHALENLVLLCSPCNQLKANTYTLSGLRKKNKKEGYMYNEGNLKLI